MFKNLIFGIALMATTSAYSGQDGNGGFGLKCGNKIQTLDLYEAKENQGLTIDLGPANLSVDEKVEKMFQRWDKINSRLAKEYRKKYSELDRISTILNGKTVIKDSIFLLGESVVPTLDIGTTIIPDNCSLVPLARNITDEPAVTYLSGKKIFFYGKYWNLLDNDNRAVLRLHELLYSNLSSTIGNSNPVRKLLAILSSENADTQNIKDIITLAANISDSLPVEINGTSFSDVNLNSIQMSDDQKFISSFEARVVGKYALDSSILNQSVRIFPLPIDTMLRYEYLDPSTPKKISVYADSAEGSPDFFEYIFLNGSIKIKLEQPVESRYYYDRLQIELHTPNLIKNMSGNLVVNTLKRKYTAGTAEFKYSGAELVGFNLSDLKQWTADSKGEIILENPYLKGAYINTAYLGKRVTSSVRLDGTLHCAKLAHYGGLFQVKIDGKWNKIANDARYVLFDQNEKPIGFDCDPSKAN